MASSRYNFDIIGDKNCIKELFKYRKKKELFELYSYTDDQAKLEYLNDEILLSKTESYNKPNGIIIVLDSSAPEDDGKTISKLLHDYHDGLKRKNYPAPERMLPILVVKTTTQDEKNLSNIESKRANVCVANINTVQGVNKILRAAVLSVYKQEQREEHKQRHDQKERESLIHSIGFYTDRIIKDILSQNNEEKINKCRPESDDFLKLDFSCGFSIFKTQQADNRKANFLLAKKLVDDLRNTQQPIADIFKDIAEKRNQIIREKSLNTFYGCFNLGINSNELNSIIDSAQKKKFR